MWKLRVLLFLFVVYVSPVPSLVVVVTHLTIIASFRIHTFRDYSLLVVLYLYDIYLARARNHPTRTIIRAKVRHACVRIYKNHYIILYTNEKG